MPLPAIYAVPALPRRFSYHPMAGGFSVELVGIGFRAQFEAWIAATAR